jgi:serine/threonine protein kinase
MVKLAAATGGDYRVERELGRGGMATVYLAHDLNLDRQVAIKVMGADLFSAGDVLVDRFLGRRGRGRG